MIGSKQPKPPRSSVNKLCEFMTARPARQRQIVHDQKYPEDYKVTYYKEASEAIARAIAGGLVDLSPINNAINLLLQKSSTSIHAQRRITSNIDALEAFQLMLDDVPIAGVTTKLGENAPPKLVIHNVEVSVRPEVILHGTSKSGVATVGAMKLHFPRTFPLTEDSAAHASAVLLEWCKTHLADGATPVGDLCPIVDVGSQRVYLGKKATAQRLKDVQAACQNYAAVWDSL